MFTKFVKNFTDQSVWDLVVHQVVKVKILAPEYFICLLSVSSHQYCILTLHSSVTHAI